MLGVAYSRWVLLGRQTQVVQMSGEPCFKAAFPYQNNILALPVADVDSAARWYTDAFGMVEVERLQRPEPAVILERDGTRIGFCVNGGDPSQHGAAILVSNIDGMRRELESKGVNTGNSRIDERDGRRFQVFFVVAPDGLCYYFHEPI
jgi:catechol 2,3-dioxygenase-like lactoylglutathione lyase family enzyme